MRKIILRCVKTRTNAREEEKRVMLCPDYEVLLHAQRSEIIEGE